MSLLLPSEPGEQTIPIEGMIAGAEVDAEWHALWTEPVANRQSDASRAGQDVVSRPAWWKGQSVGWK